MGVLQLCNCSAFKGAFFGQIATPSINLIPGDGIARTIAAGVIGGSAAKIGGGDFETGAVSAMAANAFNNELVGTAQENQTTRQFLDRQDAILYERGTSSVLVRNDVAGRPAPIVGNQQISHSLDVSASTGSQVQIISGERGVGHPLYNPGSSHATGGAIDVRISGFNSEQVADAFYDSGNFNRVSSYTDGRTSAHVDYRSTGNQGRFVDWVWQEY